MKTIEDVVKAYPDGWPTINYVVNEHEDIRINHDNMFIMPKTMQSIKFTREEYEQVKLIHHGFEWESLLCNSQRIIVTLKGLKDGYKYEWEE